MNSKTKALTLLTIIIAAATAGALVFSTQATVKADTTSGLVTSDAEMPFQLPPIGNATGGGPFNNGPMGMGMMQDFGRGHKGPSRGFESIQVSDDYIQNVTSIAKNDADVQNLINQGYNITSVKPLITTSVDGNGNVATKASTAELTLIGTNGRALVIVNLDQAKVTKIVTMTATEIVK